MPGYHITAWKKFPFLKLTISLVIGILMQWYIPLNDHDWWLIISLSGFGLAVIFFIPFFERYKLAFLSGLFSFFVFLGFGGLLTWQKDPRNKSDWLGRIYKQGDAVSVTLDEPLVEKAKTFKANATVQYLIKEQSAIPASGKIIVYFKKSQAGGANDLLLARLDHSVGIIFRQPLQDIRETGNPGGFDYKRYCIFNGITSQVYLEETNFLLLDGKRKKLFRHFIFNSREKILGILRKYIPGEKELGLAEALLIGYKNDLDKDLVQAYANTGVVHIIAISGLHLGLIYWLLIQLFKPLRRNKKLKWLIPVFIIIGLWLFSFLAGAQPSILRAALMFTCIVVAESLSRKGSIYNSLSLSAFILLCINPFWLWDVGFQLSYAAVLSIIIFMRPVYNLFYIKNKILDQIWKLNAVTLSAQILTVPLTIYYFHQFPNYFLLTNLIAVPLSSLVLFGEILLCLISFIPIVAVLAGKIISKLISFMNFYIEQISSLPGAVWENLQINLLQVILLLLFASGGGHWLMERSKPGLRLSLVALLGFLTARSLSFIVMHQQEKIIVYNVPQKKAIDLVIGRDYTFIGDSILNGPAGNFHLLPSRVSFRMKRVEKLNGVTVHGNFIHYKGLHILLVDKAIHFTKQEPKPVIDLLILSKNPKIYMSAMLKTVDIRKVVIDSSVPAWKSRYWKKDLDSLNIPWHDVSTMGAFVLNLR